jgi:GSCFA family
MTCPYDSLPATSWWQKSISGRSSQDIDPHLKSPFSISTDTKVASAGSCFAQHISQALIKRGYNYFVTEPAPAYLEPSIAAQHNYGVFSARYGNLYSALQLRQLLQRAFDGFEPADQFWMNDQGRCFDLLRPRINLRGFSSRNEAEADNRRHLEAVRELFRTAETFVFTLGLTETWRSTVDGTAYPTCPGCGSAGAYDLSRYKFENLTATTTSACLASAVEIMTAINPLIQIILTVSPVPLVATMTDRHVLQATTYSKSVLRVAAEETVNCYANVHYFASYEIITATRNTHAFFENDGRTISPDGVERAMEVFFCQFGGADRVPSKAREGDSIGPTALPKIVCDEEDFFRALATSGQR